MPRGDSWPRDLGAVPFLTFARPSRALLAMAEGEARTQVAAELEAEGYDVQTAGTGPELRGRLAGSALAGEPVDLLVADVELPGRGLEDALRGVELYGDRAVRVILIAREVPAWLHAQAARLGASIVEPTSSPAEVRDCAVMLVSPVKANAHARG